MKKLFYFVIIITVFISCNSKDSKKSAENLELESIKSGIRKDTLTNNYYFGMSKLDVRLHSKKLEEEELIVINKDGLITFGIQSNNYIIYFLTEFFYEKGKLFRTTSYVLKNKVKQINKDTHTNVSEEVLEFLKSIYGSKLDSNLFKNGTKGSKSYWLEGNKRIDYFDTLGNVFYTCSDMIVEQEIIAQIEAEEKMINLNENENEKIIENEIKNKIKAKAKKTWPNDFVTQEYWINEQIKAYKYMKKISNDKIKKRAERDWPLDFVTQKYYYDEQILAKKRIE